MGNDYMGWNYFGSQGKIFNYLKEFIDKHVKNFDKYVDLTAGGGANCYLFAKEGKKVLANDLGYYSYICNSAILNDKLTPPPNWEQVKNIKPVKAFIYNNRKTVTGDKRLFKGSLEIASYLDSYILKYSHKPYMIACLGKTLIDIFGYKGLPSMSLTLVDKRKAGDVTWNEIVDKIQKIYERLVKYALQNNENLTIWGDAKTIQNNFVKDSVVYIDPAWPYDKKQTKGDINPYWTYNNFSSLLSHGKQNVNRLWVNVSDKDIIEDIFKWIDNVFKQNVVCFIINTQSTNVPIPEILYKESCVKYGKENVIFEEVVSKNYIKLKTQYTLKEYFILIKNPIKELQNG